MAGGTLVIRFIGDLKHFEASTAKLGKRVSTTGATLTKGLTLPIVGAGAAIIKTAGGFEKSMNTVRAVTQAGEKDFAAMRKQAIDLGASTAFSASEAADAMGFLGQAGFKTREIMKAMPGTLDLAAAGQMELAETADLAAGVLRGFGLDAAEAGRVADVLAATSIKTNTDVRDLGEAFKYAGPVANSAGISFEETAAAIGLMSDAGIKASMAGTSVRGAISRLLAPTSQASALMEEMGLKVTDASGKLKPLDDIIQQLEKSGMTTGQAMQLFGQRAGPAMLALVERGSGALRKMTGELEKSGGTAERVAKTKLSGFEGAVEEMQGAWETMAIAIADSGVLSLVTRGTEKATGAIRDLTKWWKGLSPATQEWVLKLLAVLAALGPVLWIIGKLITAAGTLAKVWAALSKVTVIWGAVTKLAGKYALGTRLHLLALHVQTLAIAAGQKIAAAATMVWAGAMKVLNLVMRMNPIGLVITALTLLVLGLIAAYKKSETFRKIVNAAFGAVKDVALAVVRWIGDKVVPFFTDTLPDAFWAVVDWVRTHWKKLLPGISIPLTLARIFIDKVWGRIVDIFEAAWHWVNSTFRRAWSLVKALLFNPVDTARILLDRAWDRVRGLFSAAWDWVRGTFARLWNGLEGIVTSPLEAARRVLDRLLGTGGAFRSLFSRAVDAISSIWDGLREAAAAPVRFVVNTVYNDGIRKAVNAIPGVGDLPSLQFARGGPVPEWLGKRGVDSVAAWLMPGEHVWTAEEVRKAGGHAAIEAMRQSVLKGEVGRKFDPPKFAEGGGISGARLAQGKAFAMSQVGKPYSWGGVGPGGYDCSGFMSAITNVLRGQYPYSRVGATSTFPWAGFRSGWGQFTIGSFRGSPGHMAGTIDGLNVESAGGVGVRIGSGARGAGDPMFNTVAHLGASGKAASAAGRFMDAVKALKGLLSKVSGWWGELRSLGGWGGMMVDLGKHLIGKVRGFFADKVPGLNKLLSLFDAGGILRSGHLAANLSGRPERVLDPATTATFERLVRVLNDQSTRQALVALTRAGDLSRVGTRRGYFGPGGPGDGRGPGGPMEIRGRLELRNGEAYIAGIAEYVVNDVLDLADTSGRMG